MSTLGKIDKTDQIKQYLESARADLEIARQYLDLGKFSQCHKVLSSAKLSASKAIYSQSSWWRFLNIYGGAVWIYLIGLLVSIFFIFYFNGTNSSMIEANANQQGIDLAARLGVDRSAINAAAWGVIGAVLRAMWFLKTEVDKRRYRNAWNIYFLSIPFLGGMLGSIVYLIVLGGLVALSSGNTASVNPLTIIPFAALAGYNWLWAINIFNRIGDVLTQGKSRPE